jgi:hypothetical protein
VRKGSDTLGAPPLTPEPPGSITPFEQELAEFFGEAPADGGPPTPDQVTFLSADAGMSPLQAAENLVRYLRARNQAKGHLSYPTRINARAHTAYSGAVTARIGWQGGRFHTVKFTAEDDGRMRVSHKLDGGRFLSSLIHDWLTASDGFSDIRWEATGANN